MLKVSTLTPDTAVYRETVPAGEYWIKRVAKDQIFRIVDLEGNQAVDTLFYSKADSTDRYSFQDTIREQGNIYLTTGTRLMSTNCNVMLTITADTCHPTSTRHPRAGESQTRRAIVARK